MRFLNLLFMAALFLSSCTSQIAVADSELLDPTKYDTILNGKVVKLYTLERDDIKVQVTNYGAKLLTLIVPDRDGVLRNINWREPSIKELLASPFVLSGAIMGRAANLTGNGGLVTIDGKEYQLSKNSKGVNHASGGKTGLSYIVWDAEQSINSDGDPMLTLSFFSEDGHEGYPGNANITVKYILKESALEIDLIATTDAPTYINMTSHPFFNLHGTKSIPSISHILTINADYYTPSSEEGPLTGEIVSVEGTPLDFRKPCAIGERVEDNHVQLELYGGYNLNYIINKNNEDDMATFAELYEPATGISVVLESNQPAMHINAGPYQRKSSVENRNESSRQLRYGVGLEAQNCPNAINCPDFPDAVLYPDETYDKTILYKFSVR